MRAPAGDRGAAAVEFAIVLPVLLLLLGGLTAFGLRAVYGGSAENAARRTVTEARFVQGRTVAQMAGPLCTAALGGLPGASRGTVSRGTPGTCAPGTVDVCYRPSAAAAGACRGASDVPRPGDRVTARVELQVPFLSRLPGRLPVTSAGATAVGQVER